MGKHHFKKRGDLDPDITVYSGWFLSSKEAELTRCSCNYLVGDLLVCVCTSHLDN